MVLNNVPYTDLWKEVQIFLVKTFSTEISSSCQSADYQPERSVPPRLDSLVLLPSRTLSFQTFSFLSTDQAIHLDEGEILSVSRRCGLILTDELKRNWWGKKGSHSSGRLFGWKDEVLHALKHASLLFRQIQDSIRSLTKSEKLTPSRRAARAWPRPRSWRLIGGFCLCT